MLRQLTLASFVRWLPEASAVALVGALAPACAITSEPMTPMQRELLAQDVRDAITAARPWIGDSVERYLKAAQPILVAFIAGEPIGPAAWETLRAVESALRQTLLDAGREPEDADAILAILRIALRRIEFALT